MANFKQEQCKGNAECNCQARGYCDEFCLCDPLKCGQQRKGCSCKTSCIKKSCPCYLGQFECDPFLCNCCFDGKDGKKKNCCKNNQIRFGLQKRCVIGKSTVCGGLGLFAVEPIQKKYFIIEYLGEIIQEEESLLREKWSWNDSVYIFRLQSDKDIDARYFGNKARFINHSRTDANCESRIIMSQGTFHIALYAKHYIEPGSELLFDYECDEKGELSRKYDWIQPKKFQHKNHHKPTTQVKQKRKKEQVAQATHLFYVTTSDEDSQ